MNFKNSMARLLVAACAVATNTAAFAQAYPSRPITVVVPFPAGNSSDIAMRIVARQIEPMLGQPVVVENRGGAGGAIGAAYAARRPADGYTLLLGSAGPMAISPELRKGLSYDPVKSFDPVAPLAFLPQVFVVSVNSPIKDFHSLIQMARDNPGVINYASSGQGSTQHLLMSYVSSLARAQTTHVPYQGTAAALTDLISGQVHVMSDVLSSVLPMIRAGKIRPIAVSTAHRLDVLPDVPTVRELGFPTFDVQGWIVLFTPAGTPDEVSRRLNKAIDAAMEAPEVRKSFLEQSMLPMPVDYADLRSVMMKEITTWRSLAAASGAKLD